VPAVAEPRFWLGIVEIGLINILLSGDNALVIALAVRKLPPRQRALGQIWGVLGAILLRLAFVGIVSMMLRLPFLRFFGGLLLVWIALRLVQPEAEVQAIRHHGASLRQAIWIILVADITMSLDNVLAIAAAARGEPVLVVAGIVLSLPIVVWGAGLLARLMNRFLWIVWLGGGVLGYVAAEMALDDPIIHGWLGRLADWLHWLLPWLVGAAVTMAGWWFARLKPPRVPDTV